jgi:hypothetical protein
MSNKIINGVTYKEMGPFCIICGANYGRLSSMKKGWINPNHYESYSNNECPKCGQRYEYNEGDRIVLTEKQLDALRNYNNGGRMKGIGYLLGSIPLYGLGIASYIKYLKGIDNFGAVLFWIFLGFSLTIIAWAKHTKQQKKRM